MFSRLSIYWTAPVYLYIYTYRCAWLMTTIGQLKCQSAVGQQVLKLNSSKLCFCELAWVRHFIIVLITKRSCYKMLRTCTYCHRATLIRYLQLSLSSHNCEFINNFIIEWVYACGSVNDCFDEVKRIKVCYIHAYCKYYLCGRPSDCKCMSSALSAWFIGSICVHFEKYIYLWYLV